MRFRHCQVVLAVVLVSGALCSCQTEPDTKRRAEWTKNEAPGTVSQVTESAALAAPSHPLDPLNKAEIEAAVKLLKDSGKVSAETFFPYVGLHEPGKEELTAFQPGAKLVRQAFAVVMDRAHGKTYEAVINLSEGKLTQWQERPGAHPPMLEVEFQDEAPKAIRANAAWQAAVRKRGITNLEHIKFDVWAPGHTDAPGVEGVRFARALSYLRGTGTSPYGRPLEGLVVILNQKTLQVVDVIDGPGGPTPREDSDFFSAKYLGPPRPALKPLQTSQPEGPSFQIRGHEIAWDRWRLRYALHPREGLVLHTVGYEDEGRLRPILHRASLSEMAVPYAESSPAWNWRCAFDQGEYGLGRLSNSLVSGRDVPEHAVLLDVAFADDRGEAYVHPAGVAVYERDGGLLWKHTDEDSLRSVARRARELVVTSMTTIGNYDYGLSWIFRQDGSLELQAELTGVLLPKGVAAEQCEACAALANGSEKEPTKKAENGEQQFGTLVAKQVVAPYHQHFFNFRLDFDIDGAKNSVVESNLSAIPVGPENPEGNAFICRETVLRTEQEARRNLDHASHRHWKVVNPAARNALGHFSGYTLATGENGVAYLAADSVMRRRASFVNHHLWVTRFKPGEDHAAGDYPRQNKSGEGLPVWSADESVANEDLVLWYTFGVTHVPHAEQWPVMPVHRVGFKLVPTGFFSRNPALDVPDEGK